MSMDASDGLESRGLRDFFATGVRAHSLGFSHLAGSLVSQTQKQRERERERERERVRERKRERERENYYIYYMLLEIEKASEKSMRVTFETMKK